MRTPDLLLVAAASYLAGCATSALVHRLRRRNWPHRSELLSHWRCRRFHGRYHVHYSPEYPDARFCTRCESAIDVGELDWNAHTGCRRRDSSVPSVGDGPEGRRLT